MIKIVKVRGESMAPTLAPGNYLILTKARTFRSGFVVLVDHPKYGRIIKRISSVTDSFVRLEGDGVDSTSSDDMGDVSLSHIKGKALWAITPKGLKSL